MFLLLPALAISAAALPHAPSTSEPIVTPVECPRHNPQVQDGSVYQVFRALAGHLECLLVHKNSHRPALDTEL